MLDKRKIVGDHPLGFVDLVALIESLSQRRGHDATGHDAPRPFDIELAQGPAQVVNRFAQQTLRDFQARMDRVGIGATEMIARLFMKRAGTEQQFMRFGKLALRTQQESMGVKSHCLGKGLVIPQPFLCVARALAHLDHPVLGCKDEAAEHLKFRRRNRIIP